MNKLIITIFNVLSIIKSMGSGGFRSAQKSRQTAKKDTSHRQRQARDTVIRFELTNPTLQAKGKPFDSYDWTGGFTKHEMRFNRAQASHRKPTTRQKATSINNLLLQYD